MEFKLPDIGEGVHEGEITKWLVQVGDKVAADQPMVEVMTDKATVEIPSPVAGTVDSVFAKEGETVEVGKVIIKIAENGKAAKAAPAPSAPAPSKAPSASFDERQQAANTATRAAASNPPKTIHTAEVRAAQEPEVPFHVLATPATRKLARDLDVNLGSVSGTGPHGRVTKEDVQLAYEGTQAATPRSSHPVPTQQPSTSMTKAPTVQVPSYSGSGAEERIPLRGIRKKIAEAMVRSKHTAAHFLYAEECDMTAIVELRKGAAEEAKKMGVKLTFLPFIIKALVPALKEFRYLNASMDDARGEIVLKGDYNIGIATDSPAGLIVPVVKHVDRKSIWEIAAEIQAVTDRARNGKSTMEDLKGGTFTVTNAGSIGGVFTAPVINHPEVAILGVNAIRKRPMVVDDQIVIRDMMYFSMSVDHRVVDGADAARFMNKVVYFLQDPRRMVFA